MTNPFEDPDGKYTVLINEEEQYSLWPAFIDVPAGWSVVLESSDMQACVEFVEEKWRDLRPKSLRTAMGE